MPQTNINSRIQLKTDTTENWGEQDPVLLKGELGYDSDKNIVKIGDGSKNWSKLSSLTVEEVNGYVTSTDLTSTLESYATTANLTSAINTVETNVTNNYVSNNALNSTLANYITNSALTNTLSNYATTENVSSSINTALANYVDTNSLNTALGNYVTNSALNTTLSNYATSSDLNTAINNVENNVANTYVNNTALTNALSNYALNSALNDYLTINNASSTYLTIENANNTYQQIGNYATEENLNTLSNTVNTLSNTVSDLSGNVAMVENTVTTLNNSITEVETNVTNLSSNVALVETNVSTLSNTVTELNTSISNLSTNVSTVENNISSLQYTVSSHTTEISDIKTTIESLDLVGFKVEVVESLPSTGENGVLYLRLNASGTEQNIYDEYVWVESTTSYEKIGSTEIDLNDYYTKSEVNSALSEKQTSGNYVATTTSSGNILSDRVQLILQRAEGNTNNTSFIAQDSEGDEKIYFGIGQGTHGASNLGIYRSDSVIGGQWLIRWNSSGQAQFDPSHSYGNANTPIYFEDGTPKTCTGVLTESDLESKFQIKDGYLYFGD